MDFNHSTICIRLFALSETLKKRLITITSNENSFPTFFFQNFEAKSESRKRNSKKIRAPVATFQRVSDFASIRTRILHNKPRSHLE